MTAERACDLLFEISWEVANAVGGIHTVLASKAQTMVSVQGDDYVVVGPMIWKEGHFGEELVREEVFPGLDAALAGEGLSVLQGRWNVPGRPRCLLVDFSEGFKQKNAILERLWVDYKVESLTGGWDYVEPVLFGAIAARVLTILVREVLSPSPRAVVAQWHEWLVASGLLILKGACPEIAGVFTTHATILGRAISGSGGDLEAAIREGNPLDLARRHGVLAKHSMEAAAAREADCFTTVSAITADEAEALLGRRPDLLLPNGIGDEYPLPHYRDPDTVATTRYRLFSLAELVTGREIDRKSCDLVATAGRYEFTNKGTDIVLDAVADLADGLRARGRGLVLFLFLPTATSGPERELLQARDGGRPVAAPLLTTHHLVDGPHDPVLRKMADLGLDNGPESPVVAIFCPIFLDGRDALVGETLYQLLPAFDLTLFPSLYEPWGYTPLESAAYGVPTVTSDLAGFGRWVESIGMADSLAVHVLPRQGKGYEESRELLVEYLVAFLDLPVDARRALEAEVLAVAGQATWNRFGRHYQEAHRLADEVRRRRAPGVAPVDETAVYHHDTYHPRTRRIARPRRSEPHLRPFTVRNLIPEPLARLRDLALNLWWSWHPAAVALFEDLDRAVWRASGHNPVQMLETVRQSVLDGRAADPEYLARLRPVVDDLDGYLEARRPAFESPRIAYFCMEFGLAECLPFYSGGLGVLAGDHLKAASDHLVPLVGVGLAYHVGYFLQRLDAEGNQIEEFPAIDFSSLPMRPVRTADGGRLMVSVRLPGRVVGVQIWRVDVGAVALYLLDTDQPGNSADDRGITRTLYDADPERRLQQEIVLGIGGRKALKALGLRPQVYHMNEGHSAFLALNRFVELVRDGDLDFDGAVEFCRQTTVFTTHTPVEAGHETFPEDLVRPHLAMYQDLLGRTMEQIIGLGRRRAEDAAERFSMTVLAVRSAAAVGGVSRIHGRVTRRMLQPLLPGFLASEVPVDSVTNGVHLQTWLAPEIQALLSRHLDGRWRKAEFDAREWQAIEGFSDHDLFEIRRQLKHRLFGHVQRRLEETWNRRRDSFELLGRMTRHLDDDTLVIGIARRFAGYKRADLLFKDLERLLAILDGHPVVFLFAGKAHPRDGIGKGVLRRIAELSRRPELIGKVLLLENYDMSLARHLVQGCDVWLNNPRPPLEACGTSGMKAAINGTLNLSVLDGWWAEAYDGTNGWAIGPVPDEERDLSPELEDDADSHDLYRLLETEVLPLYFGTGDGAAEGPGSAGWMERVKSSMISGLAGFGAGRMVEEYRRRFYEPAAIRHEALEADGHSAVVAMRDRRQRIRASWEGVVFLEARVGALGEEAVTLGQTIEIRAQVAHPGLAAEDLRVEFVAGRRTGSEEPTGVETFRLELEDEVDGASRWRLDYSPRRSGPQSYGLRVVPSTPGAEPRPDFAFGLVRWA